MDAKALIDIIKRAGFSPQPYSGRGMYGRHCVSVAVSSEFAFGVEIGRATTVEVPTPTRDSLGIDWVLYWRGLDWPEEIAPEADDADEAA